jgi:hypothetical protein
MKINHEHKREGVPKTRRDRSEMPDTHRAVSEQHVTPCRPCISISGCCEDSIPSRPLTTWTGALDGDVCSPEGGGLELESVRTDGT